MVVSSTDCYPVRIKLPSADCADALCYFSRKLFYSFQPASSVWSAVSVSGHFCGLPRLFPQFQSTENYPLHLQSLYPPEDCCILGDDRYPCTSQHITLITPYWKHVGGAVETRFNRHYVKACCVIERAFGIMKTRWQSIFFKALVLRPAFAVEVISCFAILDNFCPRDGDTLEPAEEALGPDGRDDGDGQPQPDLQCGQQLHGSIAVAVLAPNNPLPVDHIY